MLKFKDWPKNWNQMNYSEDLLERFWNKVKVPEDWEEHPEKCWEWIGGLNTRGYGQFWVYDHIIVSHRFIYQCCYGSIPPYSSDTLVCHTCDNRKCVNPTHLWIGTTKDNAQDMSQKERGTFGSKAPTAILSDQIVLEILQKIENNYYDNIDQITYDYNVGRMIISRILRGLNWKHITKNISPEKLNELKNKIIKDPSSRAGTLTIDDVKNIKIRLQNGETAYSIARSYNMNSTTIYNIKNGKSWKHVII